MGSLLNGSPIMMILYAGLISFFVSFLLSIFSKGSFARLVDIAALLWVVQSIIALTVKVIIQIKGLA